MIIMMMTMAGLLHGTRTHADKGIIIAEIKEMEI
jgi:hypothetical protein